MAGGIQVLTDDQIHERTEMLKAFDDTKAGVKGLSDLGLLKLPKIFVRPSDELDQEHGLTRDEKALIHVPVIDLAEIEDPESRKRIVNEIRTASETWGFFQVVNHGIPLTVLDGMVQGIKRFNEMDPEEKKKYYTREYSQKVRFHSNYDLFTSKTANWRDTLSVSTPDEQFVPEELPESCRESTVEYSKHVKNLGNALLQLLSEALGLESDHLTNMEIAKGHRIHSHYYPACPEPELAIGTTKHSDAGFLTILLQNQLKGLQISHQGQWVDIEPHPDALVINIGDLLQLVSNGKFKSIVHRALVSRIGPRITVAYFISGANNGMSKVYGPIKELISEDNPAMYRDVKLGDYVMTFMKTGLDKFNGVDDYKI